MLLTMPFSVSFSDDSFESITAGHGVLVMMPYFQIGGVFFGRCPEKTVGGVLLVAVPFWRLLPGDEPFRCEDDGTMPFWHRKDVVLASFPIDDAVQAPFWLH